MSHVPMIEPQDADAGITEMFGEIQREMGIPFVPNIDKVLALSPNVLKGQWEALRNIYLGTSLPMPLATMILFKISRRNQCQYCGSIFRASCMMAGIDEETLAALERDLESLSPVRVQTIVRFAEKCAFDRAHIEQQDYEEVREQGVTDEEIVEIIGLAGLGAFLNTIADSLKVEVDDVIAQALSS